MNDLFVLEVYSIVVLNFFVNTYNILTLWYLAGIYLICLGFFLMYEEGDIWVGFLWVIDLGVGLVFFIFILHYQSFLHQKAFLDKTAREVSFILCSVFFLIDFFYFFSNPSDSFAHTGFQKTWFYLISWYNYSLFFFSMGVTDLNTLREIYFSNNSLEFFIINFVLLYGIISAVLLSFLIKRIFSFANVNQLLRYRTLDSINTSFFIRNQNFIKQQSTSTGTRVWLKKKNVKLKWS